MNAGIPWRPIAELPDALKSESEVLLWSDGFARVASWSFVRKRWEDGESFVLTPTHFAEINPPEGV